MTFLPAIRFVFKASILFIPLTFIVACGGGVVGDPDNYVVVEDQTVIDLKKITLATVSTKRTVCVVIYDSAVNDNKIKGVTVIGEKTLEPGEYTNVEVTLMRDSQESGETMYIELHDGSCASDSDTETTSSSVIAQGSVSAVSFFVAGSSVPYIESVDQTVSNVSLLHVKKVITNKSSWLVVYRYDATAENGIGERIGFQLVEQGHSSDVAISLSETLENADELVVALHENKEVLSDENFDAANDALIDGMISEILTITVSEA